MNRIHRLAVALLCVFAFSACYINAKLPLDRDLNRTPIGTKVGRSSMTGVLWVASWGDAGIHAAAQEGGLTTIHHADQEVVLVLLGLYLKLTTVVYGD